MTFKQFYLLSLCGLTLVGSLFHFVIWLKLKDQRKDNRAPLFIALASLSWSLVGLIKFYDPIIPELANAIKDRVLSSFSNLFLIASIPYFTATKLKWSKKIDSLKNDDRWFFNVFILFTILGILFTFMDRTITSNSGRILIITIDSIVSIFSIGIVSFAIFESIRLQWQTKSMIIFSAVILSILVLTQVLLPLITIFPKEMVNYYPFALILTLISLSGFLLFCILQFTIKIFSYNNSKDLVHTDRIKELQISGLIIGFNPVNKTFYLDLTFADLNSGKEEFKERIEFKKLLIPFVNWYIFALAKEKNIKLSYSEISLSKYRMVELWNKQAKYPIKQEQLFINDQGFFELNIDKENLLVNDKKIFNSKFLVRESAKKQLQGTNVAVEEFLK